MSLKNKLQELNNYPFHMPGHKRNSDFNIFGSEIDITEIDGFDDLHAPVDIIYDLENKYKKLYNSKKSILSVNGSTCGILSSIFALCNEGDEILIARNCHKSVYNACYLRKLNVHYIYPKVDKYGIFDSITNEQCLNAINKYPNSKCIVITTPTYEGKISNICVSIPIIIDSAHGAHLGFAKELPDYPRADIVVSSLHKTLPTLTQCSIVNIYNEEYIDNIKKYMSIFETSSPSYVLMNSMDECTEYLDDFQSYFNILNTNIDSLIKKHNNSKNFKLLVFDDKTRISIFSDTLTGKEIADVLRKNNIEPEMVSNNYVTLITTICDTAIGFNLLSKALNNLDCIICKKDSNTLNNHLFINKKIYNSWDKFEYSATKISECENKISAEYVYAFPPEIPILVPGELITKDLIKYIKNSINNNINIKSESNKLPFELLTKNDA